MSRFLELAPARRSCAILEDVFDYSLEEVATLVAISRRKSTSIVPRSDSTAARRSVRAFWIAV